jgi:predicted Zn-dependent protease
MRFNPRIIIAIIIAIAGALTYMSSSSKNEITGENQRLSLTPDQEVTLGLQALPEMEQQFGGEIHHQVNDYVEQIGQRIVSQSVAGKTPYKFDFHVLADAQTVNAFALPGGQVSVTVGMLRNLTTEAELAGVLGHEIGHVVARHGAAQLSKQQFAQSLVGAVGVATYDGTTNGQRDAAIAAAVAQLVSMRFGREDELQADSLGIHLMKQAGYDPQGMVSLMKVLQQQGGGKRQPEFFSTHPSPENRLTRLQAMASEVGSGGESGEDRYRQSVLAFMKP